MADENGQPSPYYLMSLCVLTTNLDFFNSVSEEMKVWMQRVIPGGSLTFALEKTEIPSST